MPTQRTSTSNALRLLAEQTTTALAAALRDAGVNKDDLGEALRAASGVKKTARQNVSARTDSAQLGTALALWHRDRRFTDPATGSPKPLTRTGRAKSLVALMRAAGIKSKTDAWVQFMLKSGLVRPIAGGRYLPLGRSARMPSLNALHIEHIALGVYHLVGTAVKNYTKKGRTRPLLQSATVVRTFPTTQKEQFRKFVNAQGDAFLANVDDYLEARAQHAHRASKAIKRKRAGVYAFAFID